MYYHWSQSGWNFSSGSLFRPISIPMYTTGNTQPSVHLPPPQITTQVESTIHIKPTLLPLPKTRSITNYFKPKTQIKGKKRRFRGNRGGRKRKKEMLISTNTSVKNTDKNKGAVKIFNLSNYKLTPYEVLLEKGLSFCPEHQGDPFDLFIDLQRFVRKLSLRRYFNIKDNNRNVN